jgi:hypothetical protein
MSTWKQQKESFVSDHDGGDLIELVAVAAVVPLCCGARLRLHRWGDTTSVKLAKDAVLLVAPIAASITIGADYLPALFLALAAIALATQRQQTTHTHVIRLFRACQAVFTGICILAVDFQAFPRRFCKTETYGFSLMDMGVGSFVVGNALTSRCARGLQWRPRRILPLIALGLVRLATVKASGYPEHVTEYGVHWNAFFTLAVVDLWDGLACFLELGSVGLMGAAAVIAHASHYFVDAAYVLSDAPRDSLFSANREGITSAFGYAAIFYASAAIFDFFLVRDHPPQRWQRPTALACVSASFLADTYLAGSPSRRVANKQFVLLCLGFNGWILALCAVCATGALRGVVLVVADANLLHWFLAANVTTGVFNFAVDSMRVPAWLTVAALVAKTFVDAFLVQTATAEMRLKESKCISPPSNPSPPPAIRPRARAVSPRPRAPGTRAARRPLSPSAR